MMKIGFYDDETCICHLCRFLFVYMCNQCTVWESLVLQRDQVSGLWISKICWCFILVPPSKLEVEPWNKVIEDGGLIPEFQRESKFNWVTIRIAVNFPYILIYQQGTNAVSIGIFENWDTMIESKEVSSQNCYLM